MRRHWIDASRLTCGSANGVVYVRGELKRVPLYPALRGVATDEELALLHALERDLARIEGVKDVIFEIEGFERRGDHWERTHSPTTPTGN